MLYCVKCCNHPVYLNISFCKNMLFRNETIFLSSNLPFLCANPLWRMASINDLSNRWTEIDINFFFNFLRKIFWPYLKFFIFRFECLFHIAATFILASSRDKHDFLAWNLATCSNVQKVTYVRWWLSIYIGMIQDTTVFRTKPCSFIPDMQGHISNSADVRTNLKYFSERHSCPGTYQYI